MVQEVIRRALAEDLGDVGDITSKAVIGESDTGVAVIRSKEAGVLAGAYLLRPLFGQIDTGLDVSLLMTDGARLTPGTEIAGITGSVRSILAGERTALNFLQRLSGIATSTARLVSLIHGTGAVLLDTRKTTPMLRSFEKKAVAAGGGRNHRHGLYDMVLIKDTHVKAAGGPGPAVRKAREFWKAKPEIKIEVEVRTVDEFGEAVAELPDRIMLDNMEVAEIAACVAVVREKGLTVELEASGMISEESIRSIAETGVDYISAGRITHSAPSLDIHLVLT